LLNVSITQYSFYVEVIIENLQTKNFANLKLKSALQESIPSIIAHLDLMEKLLASETSNEPLDLNSMVYYPQTSVSRSEAGYVLDRYYYSKPVNSEITREDINSRGLHLVLYNIFLQNSPNDVDLYNAVLTGTLNGRVGDEQRIMISLHQNAGGFGRPQLTAGGRLVSFRLDRNHNSGFINLDIEIDSLRSFYPDPELTEIFRRAGSNRTHHWRLPWEFRKSEAETRRIFKNFTDGIGGDLPIPES